MKELKRKVSFLDAEGHRARIEVEITKRNGYPEFTASGSFMGSSGQCLDDIKPANHEQGLLIRLWEEYHLKNVEDIPDSVQFHPDFTGHVEGILNEIERKEKEREAETSEKIGENAILAKMEEEGIGERQLEAVLAYIDITGSDDLQYFEESYYGEFGSDEDFAQDTAENIGAIDRDVAWPHNCIDWEQAARDLMMDYSESNGYYFRNL